MASDLAELKRIAEAASKAAPGAWESDSVRSEDGSGPCIAFEVSIAKDQPGRAWTSLVDTLNSGNAWMVQEDEELPRDENGFLVCEHIATFDPPTCLALIAENTAQAARIEALEAGLRPFGDAAEAGDDGTPDTAPAWESGMAMAVTHGDFRRAANLLGDRHDA